MIIQYIVDALSACAAIAAAVFWWKSAVKEIPNEDDTPISTMFNFFRDISKWNSYAAMSAVIAAGLQGISLLLEI